MVEGMDQGLLPTFMKHIVAVSLLDAKRELEEEDLSSECEPKHILFSSFVVSVRKIWFLITAGHILEDIEKRIKSGRKIIKARLVDNQSALSIPFDFADAPKIPIYKSGYGIDYGAIMLRPLYVQQLYVDGVRAFNEEKLEGCTREADKYFLLGFPTQARRIEHTRTELSGGVSIDIGCPLIPIEPVDSPPAELQLQEERFYARVPIINGNIRSEDGKMTDIDGMSGGPIIAVKKINSEKIRYWIIAVQSSWVRDERILAACYMKPFVNALRRCIEELQQEALRDGNTS